MVSVRGQMASDSQLVDMSQVKREYWSRKKVFLPSLAAFNQPTGFFRWFRKQKEPCVVIRRLSEEEWRMIDERFYDLKQNLARDAPTLRQLVQKMMDGEMLSKKQMAVLNAGVTDAKPIYVAMLEYMLVEPDMDYDDVQVLLDAVDQQDRDVLMAYVNMLTSEKMSVTQAILQEQRMEVEEAKAEMLAQVNG